MGAALAQAALVHDENAVGALDGGEAVRDDDGRAALHQPCQSVANAEFGLRVHAGGGFVQNQVSGVVRQRARKTDELLLAGGKACRRVRAQAGRTARAGSG